MSLKAETAMSIIEALSPEESARLNDWLRAREVAERPKREKKSIGMSQAQATEYLLRHLKNYNAKLD